MQECLGSNPFSSLDKKRWKQNNGSQKFNPCTNRNMGLKCEDMDCENKI